MEKQPLYRFALGQYTVEVVQACSRHAVRYEAALYAAFGESHLREVLVTAGRDELHGLIRLLSAAATVMDGLLSGPASGGSFGHDGARAEIQRPHLASATAAGRQRGRGVMAHVIAGHCLGTRCGACAAVCPVECIDPRRDEAAPNISPRIAPDLCIDCGLCVDECPVGAVFPEQDVPGSPQTRD